MAGSPARRTDHLAPPWQPGESGNALGKHKNYRDVVKLARDRSAEALQVLLDCMRDPEAPWPVRVTAASTVLDRAWGRAREHIELEGGPGVNELRVVFVQPGERENQVLEVAPAERADPPTIDLSFEPEPSGDAGT